MKISPTTMEQRGDKIIVLPNKLVSLIAAGEVIDRPSAVVKELVENSIDALATRIEVNVRGTEFISVFDDGEGMSEKDAILSVQKHTTSKISSEEDLNSIRTFGFRGEALHSIAVVSKMTVRTRTKDSDLGVEVVVEGGKIKSVKKIYMEPGTHVTVKELFYNTPVRKKFLSTENVEFSHILDVMARFALAFPEIGLKLLKNGEIVFALNKGRTLAETIRTIFGEVKDNGLEVSFQVGDVEVEGIIWSKKIGIGRWTFVNRRYVKDKTTLSAILKFDFLKNSEHVLFIKTPPEFYDVNVNPTKTEIRWRSPVKMREIIAAAVEDAIRHRYKAKLPGYPSERSEEGRKDTSEVPLMHEVEKDRRETTEKIVTTEKILDAREMVRVLGVIKGIYAIVEFQGDVYFVDLHAYHEGKYFRELMEKFSQIDRTEILKFVIPFELNLPKPVVLRLKDRKDDFSKIGVELEFDADDSKVRIFSIPYYLSGFDLSEFLIEFADGFETKKLEKFLAGVACRAAMRRGDRLDSWDAMQILWDFDPAQRCAHGRPAVIKLDPQELEKKFGRC